MEVFFFILALIVIGIVYLIDQNTDARLREAMQRAWQQREFQEYDRLAQKLNARASQPSREGPMNFFAALFLLDFLDHGLFYDDHPHHDGGWDHDQDWKDGEDGGWGDDDSEDDTWDDDSGDADFDNDYNDDF